MKLHRTALIAAIVTTAVTVIALPALAEETSFTDGEHDAYNLSGGDSAPPSAQPPNPLLSDPNADILEAGFATATPAQGGPNHSAYTASITIKELAEDGYNYVVAGNFGTDCQIYHFLTPGITSFANAFCGTGEERRFIGRISGSAVVQDGNTVTATYTYMSKKLPAELAADPELGGLFAFSCVGGTADIGCGVDKPELDVARDNLATFRI